MDERSLQSIKEHLQQEDAQKRILQHIQKGRAESDGDDQPCSGVIRVLPRTSCAIGKSMVFSIPCVLLVDGKTLYTLRDLDKLAIIRELIDAGYAPGDIPPDNDQLWFSAYFPGQGAAKYRLLEPFVAPEQN